MTDTTGLHWPEVSPDANSSRSRSWPPTSSSCSSHAMTALPSEQTPSRKISTQHHAPPSPRALIVDPDQAAAFEAAVAAMQAGGTGRFPSWMASSGRIPSRQFPPAATTPSPLIWLDRWGS
jgi:hypothetical protein